ncbi:WecB/TagA/CpsF family glycosyltransferase [uncultured Sphingomonas sp.]|uniref:WecB/TagA/CpsF family glycosyltransferase n=1 Tax=uncultured Sphingomonas sp. TaxID=158754 RepID=UPI0025FEADDF|nr:WecB/TagA/CpsF family glycosyltransferase [uncultured Sphingomonas sp.]
MTKQGALNIVHVVRQFHPGIGGLENFVEQLATHQLNAGCRVTVVTLDRIFDDRSGRELPAFDTHRGIEIRRVRWRGSRRYPLAPAVLNRLRDADLVHVHGVDFFCDYLAATAPLHRKPMVLTTHGGFFHTSFARGLKTAYFKTVTRLSLSRYRAVIACSEEDARTFRPIAGDRLSLIPNPVDVDKFAALADPQSSTLIYFGRLAPNKEVGRLIAWFAGLAERRARWRLIVAGKPMGVHVAELVEQVEALGLSERVEVHDTPSDSQLRQLIGRSSVYACASAYEGFGLAAVEGASAGLFPVLSDIPPFRNTLDRIGYGVSIDFADPASWNGSYRQFEETFEAFRASFDLGRVRDAVEPFAWSAAIDAFNDVYDRVLGRSRRRIGHVRVDVLEKAEAASQVLGAAHAGRPLMVAFCNAHSANLAARDKGLRDALGQAMVLNDGIGVDIASRALFGDRFPANLNGTDFVPHLLGVARGSVRLFLLGAAEGVADAAAAAIRDRYPHVQVVGTRHGFFGENQDGEILDIIRRSGANMVLVAMGQPRQELWAARHYQQIAGPVLCVGALFDFLARRVPRAPKTIRKLRLEWAFRLAQEPRRLGRRYLIGNLAFIGRILKQRLAGHRL